MICLWSSPPEFNCWVCVAPAFRWWSCCWELILFHLSIESWSVWLLVWRFESRQANLCLRAFRHDKFQLRMSSLSEGPGIWFSVWQFLLIHCLYERAAKVPRGDFAARIDDKYQIRLTRSIWWVRRPSRGSNNIYVYEPQQNQGEGCVHVKLIFFFFFADRSRAVLLMWLILIVSVRSLSVCLWLVVHFI